MYLSLLDLTTLLANVATFLGVPIAIFVFVREQLHKKHEKELETYSALNDKYIEYLKLCLDHPELGIFDPNPTHDDPLPERKTVAFEILVSILERAYFQYRGHSSGFKGVQWTNWNDYMRQWLANEEFQTMWNLYWRHEFDNDFCAHMDLLLDEMKARGK